MQDITRKYKVVNHVDKENLEWNTDLIEAMELEHVMSQDAQDLDDGEKRHESREKREHPVQRETTRKLDNQTSRAEEVCLNNACMHDVHMTSPHDSSRPRSRP